MLQKKKKKKDKYTGISNDTRWNVETRYYVKKKKV